MIPSSGILSLVTLAFHINNWTDLTQYKPKYLESSQYIFYNSSDNESIPRFVDNNAIFYNRSILFPKCCPPGLLYDIHGKYCVEAELVSSIFEELNVSTNFIYYGLSECPIIIDRYVKKDNLNLTDGDPTLRIENTSYTVGRFCLDKTIQDDNYYVIRLCQEREYCLQDTVNGSRNSCVYKCCPDTYSLVDNACKRFNKAGFDVIKNSRIFETVDNYGFLYGDNLHCGVANWLNIHDTNFTIKKNGSLFQKGDTREYIVDEYCMDTRYNTKADTFTDLLIICEFNKALYAQWTILRIITILGCVCLALTIAVYVFVYKLQKLVEKIITCFCLVDLVFWILYILRLFYVDFEKYCTHFGYVYTFMLIARLSWLNVLSYEIWRTIGRVRSKIGETSRDILKKFMNYCAYATAIPAICTLFFILSDQQVYPISTKWKPYINPQGCATDFTKKGNYGYLHLYIPIWILIIINIVLYAKTLQHFLKVKNDLDNVSGSVANQKEKKTNKKKGYIIIKLGLVMGVTWIYYIYDYVMSSERIEVLITIGDILRYSNILEGFYFLGIFVVKWKKVKEIFFCVSHFLHIPLKVGRNDLKATPSNTSNMTTCTTLSNNSIEDPSSMTKNSKDEFVHSSTN